MAMINFAPRFRGDADRAGPMPARRMQLADALMGRQTPNAMYSKGEGIAHVLDKSLAGFLAGQAERDEAAAEAQAGESIASLFLPGGSAANPQAAAMGNILAGGEQGSRSTGPASGEFSEIGPRLMTDLMRDFELTPEQAAGVVGNLAHETGGFRHMQEISPVVPGSRGGFGFAQWTGPRRRQFESWASEQGLDPNSYDANYGFLAHELRNTPEGRVLGDLRGAQDAASAARVFSDRFLRPGIPHMDSRLAMANQALGFAPSMADMPAPGASPASGQAQPDIAQALAQLHPENQPQAAYASMPGEDPQQIGAMLAGQQGTLGEAGIDPRETFFARTGGADSFGLDGPEPFTRGAIPDRNALIGLGPRGGGVAAMEANPLAVPEQPQAMPPMQPPVEVPPAPPVTSVADMPAPQAMPAQAQPPQMMIDPEPYAGDGWIPPDVGRALAAQQMGQPIPPQAMGAALMSGASQPAMAAGMPQQAGGGAMPSQGGAMPMQGGMPAGGAPMPAQPGMGGGDMDAALRQALANPRTRNAAIQILQQRQAQEQQAAQEQAARQARLDAAGARGIDPRMVGDDEAWKAALREDPTSIREYQKAVEQGYPGSFLDFQTTMAEAKRPQTNVSVDNRAQAAPPQPGYRRIYDENGNILRDEPIPGGSVDREIQQASLETEKGRQNFATAAGTLIQDAGRAIELMDTTNSWLPVAGAGSGIAAAVAPFWGNYDPNTMRGHIESVQSNIGIDRIVAMREAGGTLGAIPFQQQVRMESLLGRLNPDGDPAVLRQNLMRIHNLYWDMVDPENKLGNKRFDLPFDDSGFSRESGNPADQGYPISGEIVDGYRFTGGDPGDPNNWERVQ